MRINIVTLNYNGSKETLALLNSLKECAGRGIDVIVVDNASEEADVADLQSGIGRFIHSLPSEPPWVSVIRNDRNLGFSGGNNAGIRRALDSGSEWVVLLNNDTWVDRGFVGCLKAVLVGGTQMESHAGLPSRKTGIVAIPMIEGDRVAYGGRVRWLNARGHHSYNERAAKTEKNIYAIGGAMAVHRDVFRTVGLLDEKYFLYFEDMDFSIRARRAGFGISMASDCLGVHHRVSASAKKIGSPLLMRYHYRNALYCNFKHGPWWVRLVVYPWGIFVQIKQTLKIALGIKPEHSRAIRAGVADFYRGRFGKI